MKQILITLLLISFSFSVYSQNGPINVYLKGGGVINTNYVSLYYANFKGPVVQVDGEGGDVVSAKDVNYIEGVNSKGDTLYSTTAQFQGKRIWVKRVFKSDRIEIFTESLQQINYRTGFNYTWKLDYYRKDGGQIVAAKYDQMKFDLADNNNSMKYLRKGNGARIAQIALYGAGIGFIVASIASFSKEENRPGPGSSSNTGMNIPPTFIGAAVCLVVPLILNPGKQQNFIKALKAYE
ncbi:hypothetical protein SAMN05661096_02016 [Marivirga sericea]|uniref:DUF4178 domain-containing protein n=1 Tax=Marivirga sericea TaxID=1028 RepID=A0A1X7JRJ8_9BACT|nr:hypothetical protein [Marivirga sericea]SMG30936.1 hypothetical protein SAMN05661096_02016 [Marivirga sericea]